MLLSLTNNKAKYQGVMVINLAWTGFEHMTLLFCIWPDRHVFNGTKYFQMFIKKKIWQALNVYVKYDNKRKMRHDHSGKNAEYLTFSHMTNFIKMTLWQVSAPLLILFLVMKYCSIDTQKKTINNTVQNGNCHGTDNYKKCEDEILKFNFWKHGN